MKIDAVQRLSQEIAEDMPGRFNEPWTDPAAQRIASALLARLDPNGRYAVTCTDILNAPSLTSGGTIALVGERGYLVVVRERSAVDRLGGLVE